MKTKAHKKIFTFLGLTAALSVIFYYLIIKAGSLQAYGGALVLGLMWMPGISGMATQWIYERSLRGMGWKPGEFKYLILAYLLPLVYCLVVYGLTWITGLGNVPNADMMAQVDANLSGLNVAPLVKILLYSVFLAVFGLFMGLITGAGEEIGWRGLFVPELAKVTSFRNTTLISGFVWALWHMPLIIFANYNLPGVPRWYAVLMFTILVVGISTVFAWLRLKSGSLWPAAVFHASHNLFVQTIFTPLTAQTKITPYIIDEFGIGLALAGIVLAIIFVRKAKSLPTLQG